VPERETFYVIRHAADNRGEVVVTVLHEVPDKAERLGVFGDPGAAIDFAQQEVRRLVASGVAAVYVDPPDDLVGAG
jgi:hypothetical protein